MQKNLLNSVKVGYNRFIAGGSAYRFSHRWGRQSCFVTVTRHAIDWFVNWSIAAESTQSRDTKTTWGKVAHDVLVGGFLLRLMTLSRPRLLKPKPLGTRVSFVTRSGPICGSLMFWTKAVALQGIKNLWLSDILIVARWLSGACNWAILSPSPWRL